MPEADLRGKSPATSSSVCGTAKAVPLSKTDPWLDPTQAELGWGTQLTDHVWGVDELVALMPQPVAKKRGPTEAGMRLWLLCGKSRWAG